MGRNGKQSTLLVVQYLKLESVPNFASMKVEVVNECCVSKKEKEIEFKEMGDWLRWETN